MGGFYCFQCQDNFSSKNRHLKSFSHSFGYLNRIILDNFCKFCGKRIPLDDKRQIYCNSSCAASYTNVKYPKREKDETCIKCGIKHKRRGIDRDKCENCISYKKSKHKVNKSLLGYNARNTLRNSNIPQKCFICGYDKHVDVCHIKQTFEFNQNATINEINSIYNLIFLCKNHHWELDKLKEKYITEKIKKEYSEYQNMYINSK